MPLHTVLSALKSPLRPVRNLYYRGFPRLRRKVTGKRRILLYVNNPAMTSHIQRYAQPLLQNPTYAFFLYDPGFPGENDPSNEFQQFILQNHIPRVQRPALHAWDLIVCADMRTPASFTREMTPILYVNHGLHIISADGGETLYCYGDYARREDGGLTFSAMCEPNAMILKEMQAADPELAQVIRHTGYKFYQDVDAALKDREETRQRLGVTSDICLVGLFGSWRKDSLFHALGSTIFDVCLALRKQGYQFLFSIHPNEYSPYDGCDAPLGSLVDAQQEKGMLVRSPKEDFAPYLAACDIVISDFSSMAESAMLFGRKLIFSPYPEGMVWKHSLTAKAREALPTLQSPEDLGEVLEAVRYAPTHPFIEEGKEQLLRPDHDEIMAALTAELLERGASPRG